MTEPRGHHLVAQHYQRGFARRSGKAWQVRVVNRKTGEVTLRNAENSFKRRDWNTMKTEDGELDFTIENLLAEHVDGPAAPVLAALREGTFPLDPASEAALSTFMAAQLTRGRMIRENLARFVEQATRDAVQLAARHYTDAHWLRAIGEVPDPETIAALAANGEHVDLKATNGLLLDALLSPIDGIAELLSGRIWTLVGFGEPCLFTGEHPVVGVAGEGGAQGIAGVEQLHFPVSPSRTLLLSQPWADWPEAAVRGTRSLAGRLNWATFSHPANEELLTHPELLVYPLPGVELLRRGGVLGAARRREGATPWT